MGNQVGDMRTDEGRKVLPYPESIFTLHTELARQSGHVVYSLSPDVFEVFAFDF
jgi:hypothetical protein